MRKEGEDQGIRLCIQSNVRRNAWIDVVAGGIG